MHGIYTDPEHTPRGLAAATRIVPELSQLCAVPCQHTPAVVGSRADLWQRLRQAVAPLHTRHGCWTDGSRLDAAGGAAVPRAAVGAASGGVSKPWWWETATGGDLRRRHVPVRPASRASPGVKGPLGGHESPLF